MAEREELRAEITLDDRKFQEGAKRTETRVGTLMKWIAGIGAVVGTGVAAWKLWNMHIDAGNSKLLNMGRAFALTRQEIGFLNSLAKASGQSFNNLARAFDLFSGDLGAGIEKNRGFKRALKEIGIEAFQSTAATGKFLEILKALAAVGDRFERQELARQIFGGGAGGVRGITALGPREMKGMLENAERAYQKLRVPEVTARPPRAPTFGQGVRAGVRGGLLGGQFMGGIEDIPRKLPFRGVTEKESELRSQQLEDTLKQIEYNTQGLKDAMKDTVAYGIWTGLRAAGTF